jgi:hypothetical protein
MIVKICTKCKETKSIDSFSKKGRGLQATCRPCQSIIAKERYRKNRDSDIRRSVRNKRLRTLRNIEKMSEYLRSHPCVDCGESDPIVLEFDHIRDKLYDISDIMDRSWEK